MATKANIKKIEVYHNKQQQTVCLHITRTLGKLHVAKECFSGVETAYGFFSVFRLFIGNLVLSHLILSQQITLYTRIQSSHKIFHHLV